MVVKAELHCHIEGAADPALVLAQAEKYGVDASHVVDAEKGYIWKDFTSFLAAYDFAAGLFRTAEDYKLLAEDYYLRLSRQDAIYGEVFVSPDHAARIGCSYKELIEAISEGIDSAGSKTGIIGRIIIVGVRHAGVEAVVKAARDAVNYPHPKVTGFGMAGDERFGKQEDFTEAFRIAGDGGLQLTVHAGEFAGADSVRNALDHLGVSRIGHGVRAIEDMSLVERIANEQITLEVCPASNIALGVYPDYASHPLPLLEKARCRVTLNSDDPPHFHSSITREYEIAKNEFGFDEAGLLKFTRTAIEAAFVDEDTRKMLLAKCGS